MTCFLSEGLSALAAAPALSLVSSALLTLQPERKLAADRRTPAISLRWVRRVTSVLLLLFDSCIAFPTVASMESRENRRCGEIQGEKPPGHQQPPGPELFGRNHKIKLPNSPEAS